MKLEVKVPAVGESITEATIGQWLKKSGEAVKINEVLMLLETDKASVEVVAETSGVLEIKVQAGQTVPIGSVVASIDSDATASAAPAAAAPTASQSSSSPSAKPSGAPTAAPQMSAGAGAEAHPDLKSVLSPAVQKTVTERGLDPATIPGTGRGGRLTKEDVMNAPRSGSSRSLIEAYRFTRSCGEGSGSDWIYPCDWKNVPSKVKSAWL